MRLPIQGHRCRAAAAGWVALLLLACSPGSRLKVMGFFFDGVPGGSPSRIARPADRPQAAQAAVAGAKPRPTPLPIVSTHKPVVERQCRQCHEIGGGIEPFEVSESLCDKCHKAEREKEGWDHGPINLGSCLPCHRAHESPYPHLLDKPLPEVCLICHKADMERGAKHHQVANVNACTACHDPHRMDRSKR